MWRRPLLGDGEKKMTEAATQRINGAMACNNTLTNYKCPFFCAGMLLTSRGSDYVPV
jgi:hypothetical protein